MIRFKGYKDPKKIDIKPWNLCKQCLSQTGIKVPKKIANKMIDRDKD